MGKNDRSAPSGLILLRKSPGETSFEALAQVKRAIASGKAGHTGTLDKFAQGLLVALTGRALKLSQWFSRCDKRYEATVFFGAETETLDPEGEVVARAPVPTREAVVGALDLFRGRIMQKPPEYSAIRIDGQRASRLARQGQAPEMRARPVEIYDIDLVSWDPPFAGLALRCSSGTYVRALARDLALAVESRAHLTALSRTQVAGFRLDDAASPDDLRPAEICPAHIRALGLPIIDADEAAARAIVSGKPLREALAPPADIDGAAAVFYGERLLAVIEREQERGQWKYGLVYARD